MTKIKTLIRFGIVTGLLSLSFASGVALAADPYAGQMKAQTCKTCHGDGDAVIGANTPIISGQYEDYIVQSLRAYKSGERQNAIMAGFAAQLTEADIRDIAAYYANMDSSLFTPEE